VLFCDIWHELQIRTSESVLLPRATPPARRRLCLRCVKSKRPRLQNKSLFCPLLGVMSRYIVFKTKAPAFDCKAGALLLIRRRRSLRRARGGNSFYFNVTSIIESISSKGTLFKSKVTSPVFLSLFQIRFESIFNH